jgi:aminopeptidase N
MANALQDAAIAGFAHPSQANLLAPYVDKYFQDVAGVWERRSIEVAQKVAVGLFPRWAVDQRTVDLALAWDEQDHPPALRRLVSEGRASIERSLRARAADAEG